MLCSQPKAGLMIQTLEKHFSYDYVLSFLTRECGTQTTVTGSASLVADNLLQGLQLTLEATLHKHWLTNSSGGGLECCFSPSVGSRLILLRFKSSPV